MQFVASEPKQFWQAALQAVQMLVALLRKVPGGQFRTHCPLNRLNVVAHAVQTWGDVQLVHCGGQGVQVADAALPKSPAGQVATHVLLNKNVVAQAVQLLAEGPLHCWQLELHATQAVVLAKVPEGHCGTHVVPLRKLLGGQDVHEAAPVEQV
jgi:hypothetical protein